MGIILKLILGNLENNVMKKIIASASLAALSAASLQIASAQGLASADQSKIWSVSATLRGFYDDNYATVPNNLARDSFGFEISPAASLLYSLDQTVISLDYKYSLKYYEDRSSDEFDQAHVANLSVDQKFSEKFKLQLTDSFVYAQEPELLYPGLAATKMRLEQDAMRNIAGIKMHADFTDQFGLQSGYKFSWYDYRDAYYSWLLDRFEHMPYIDFRWRALPTLVGLIGYQFEYVDHTNGDTFATVNPSFAANPLWSNMKSDYRDSLSHYIYAGADYNWTTVFTTAVRLGAQFTEWPNVNDYALGGMTDDSDVSPYVDANATYTFLEGSYLQVGVKHSRIQSDTLSLDQEATLIYGMVNYRILPNLSANLLGQYQFGDFYQYYTTTTGSVGNNYSDNYWVVGLNMTYRFNPYLAAEVGYNFDRLDSDVPNYSFTRNRVYIGVRASY